MSEGTEHRLATGATDEPAHPHHVVAPRAWFAVLVLAALFGTLAVLKLVGSTPAPSTTLSATSTAVLDDLAGIPASEYDAVGVHSALVPIAAPTVARGLPELSAGRGTPIVLYVGTEYCSFCASERWSLVAALSRFGTFSRLYEMSSTSTDFAPDTPSFTFFEASYASRYVRFRPYEVASDLPLGGGYAPLMRVPRAFSVVVRHVDPQGTFPFVDVGGRVVVRLAAFSPTAFYGETRDQVAADLADPTNLTTRAIVASANYLSAAICATDEERPRDVCASSGVRAADSALGLSG